MMKARSSPWVRLSVVLAIIMTVDVSAFLPPTTRVTSVPINRILPPPNVDNAVVAKESLMSPTTLILRATTSSTKETRTLIDDAIACFAHVFACVVLAFTLCAVEDFDCANLKPNVTTLRPQAIGGMGANRIERILKSEDMIVMTSVGDVSLVDTPSYNEVMQFHRFVRVPKFRAIPSPSDESVVTAVQALYRALDATQKLKGMSTEYDWDGLRWLLRSPVLSEELQDATITLRGATSHLSVEARAEIGFDWGSCAWRHCGAAADAQEALAELYNLSGVLEPFECQFIINIVERSLRDMIAVVPTNLQPQQKHTLPPYPIHESRNVLQEDDEFDGMTVDDDYLQALERFRAFDVEAEGD